MDLTKLRGQPIGRLIRRKLQYAIFRQKWNIGVTRYPASIVSGLEGWKKQRRALSELLWMKERRDAFAADPFIALRPGRQDEYLIFFEYFPWRRKRGRIDCVQFVGGEFGDSKISLDSSFHLSYPYVLRYSGECVMIPEHSEARDLSFYRFDDAGVATTSNTIKNNIGLVDSTILYFNDKYWIFATHAGQQDNTDLYVYYSNDLNGPWKSHGQNPVKSDISNARPAGQFIHYAGKLFRPAQDCRSHYGSGIVINELKILTENAFAEVPVSEIRPESGCRYEYGLHTISSVADYTVVDGARVESSLHPLLDGLGRFIVPKAAPAAIRT